MKNKQIVKETEFEDIINKLQDAKLLDFKKNFSEKRYNLFFCALGFEERCLNVPENLANVKTFKCEHALYFEPSTNKEDNEVNLTRLLSAFKTFSEKYSNLKCDDDQFTKNLRVLLDGIIKSNPKPKILFDISVCSSRILISVINVLFEFNIDLTILYSEAKVYHPTREEFEKDEKKWTTEEGFGLAIGVGGVIPSPEYPGTPRQNPDLIIAFPTFKPERTNAIITYIDESLLIRPEKNLIWIVGDPHMDSERKEKRKEMIRRINNISEESTSYEISTLDYKATLRILEHVYRNYHLNNHINISALGSKMQSLGIALFCFIRPEVSVYLAVPKKYNPSQYSEGCKDTWIINLGDLDITRQFLNSVGLFVVTRKNN